MASDTHDIEIESADRLKFRVSCSCGFLGPWRKHRRTARKDRDAHEERRAWGEA
jgi:hypothetical protein